MKYPIVLTAKVSNGTIQGRNGTFEIKALQIEIYPKSVYISGISKKRGIEVNGGFQLDRESFSRLQATI